MLTSKPSEKSTHFMFASPLSTAPPKFKAVVPFAGSAIAIGNPIS